MPSKYELEELDEWVLIEEEDAQLLPETELILIDSLLILKGLRDLKAWVEAFEVLHQELTDDEEEAWDTRNWSDEVDVGHYFNFWQYLTWW